jgi:hypothetical protein
MTERVQPAHSTDSLEEFHVDAAENEGMPPVAEPRNRARPDRAQGRRAASGTGGRTTKTRPSPRLIARMSILAGLVASLAFPALAQDGRGALPDNALARGQGGGWDCDVGYRVDGTTCREIEIPENAYATGREYGTGWACRRGYEEVFGVSCKVIPVPPNAFLRSSGFDWQCDRGFRPERDSCVPVTVPENAYLSDERLGSGWTCNRGFIEDADRCVPIAVPENGYLTNADYGDAWACERGFAAVDDRCEAVAVPANAFLDPQGYGPGWRCERGFEPAGDACLRIDLPENAHLDHSGNKWSCDNGFQPSDGACVLGR